MINQLSRHGLVARVANFRAVLERNMNSADDPPDFRFRADLPKEWQDGAYTTTLDVLASSAPKAVADTRYSSERCAPEIVLCRINVILDLIIQISYPDTPGTGTLWKSVDPFPKPIPGYVDW